MPYFSKTSLLLLLATQLTSTLLAISIVPFPPPPERDVSSMCASATCFEGNICRVVKACDDPACLPHVECVPCVPPGVDEICNSRDYINTVLVGKGQKHKSLLPLHCNASLNNDETGCPKGSVCAPNDNKDELGACCYGKPNFPIQEPINSDPQCEMCEKKCPPGLSCQSSVSSCGKVTYSCRPSYKPGRCPPIPYTPPKFCWRARIRLECEIDDDCEGDKKCCKTVCAGRACLSPF